MAIARGTTLIDQIIPVRQSRSLTLLQDAALIVSGSILMALSARFQIHLPITPVPITLQTFTLMLLAASLGSWRGSLTMTLYLLEGAAGLPVFTRGGGLLYFVTQPTAGFLLAYPFSAFVIGWLCERGLERRYLTSILAMLPGSLIFFTFGVTGMTLWLNGDVMKAIATALLPFIPGDIIKQLTAAALLPTAWWIIRQVRNEPMPHDPSREKKQEQEHK